MAYTLVTVTNIVTASDYNNLQSEVAKLLGAGSGNRGYGQTMTSGQVAQSQTITAVHMNNLKTDLDKIAMHQTGAVAKTGPTLTGSDAANEVSDLGIVNAGNEILAGSTSEATAVTRAFNDYQQALENLIPRGVVLNVNFPVSKDQEIKGIKICRQANAYWVEKFDKRTNPQGKEYYWLTGDFINEDKGEDTDEWALKNGFISIVPTQFDFTAHHSIQQLNTWNF